jgi:flagellum-specific peptidoglycan hydrolase FlgJ
MNWATLTGIGATPQRVEFIEQYYPLAIEVTEGTGIFPEVLITQAIVESQGRVNGNWYPGMSALTQATNNYFGIKGQGDAGSLTMATGEVFNGQTVTVPGTFAKYTSIEASFQDYVDFLQRNPRYANAGVFDAITPFQQMQALKNAGYATNPNYANLLYQVYEPLKDYMLSIYNSIPRAVFNGGLFLLGGLTIYFLYKYYDKNKG